ncbi:MAG TPA: hypothetical protein VKZ83_07825 [Phototrophicaceae bacterium]|nr:hypothetical protein [Phototrophicaceae bacterium]
MHRSRLDARPGLVVAVAALLPALAAVLSGMVHVTRCVSVPGGIAHIGIDLALLRRAAECPTTGVALGGESDRVLAVVVLLTAPMLLLHAGVLLGTWGATAALRRSLARLARLTPWRRVPRPRPLVVPARRRAVVVRLAALESRTPVTSLFLRGPPAVLPA